MARENLTGRVFGHLTALAPAPDDRHGNARWHCRCECGRITVARAGDLKRGKHARCGAHALSDRSATACARFAPRQLRGWSRELARVAATEGEPARENFRRRAWLNPHLRAALPAEKREVAA